MHEFNSLLARQQIELRVAEAAVSRRGHHLARTHRLTRKAELAAVRARTALARVI